MKSGRMSFNKLDIKIPISFIRDGNIKGYTKMIILIELCYMLAQKRAGDCKRFPAQADIVEYLGGKTCRQTVSLYRGNYGYDIYSPARQSRICTNKKCAVTIPANIIMEESITMYERLILIDIASYIIEGFDDISKSQIGKDLGIKERCVSKYIHTLVCNGLLIKQLSSMPNAGVICNCYAIPANF